jgi:hypothetical protein
MRETDMIYKHPLPGEPARSERGRVRPSEIDAYEAVFLAYNQALLTETIDRIGRHPDQAFFYFTDNTDFPPALASFDRPGRHDPERADEQRTQELFSDIRKQAQGSITLDLESQEARDMKRWADTYFNRPYAIARLKITFQYPGQIAMLILREALYRAAEQQGRPIHAEASGNHFFINLQAGDTAPKAEPCRPFAWLCRAGQALRKLGR